MSYGKGCDTGEIVDVLSSTRKVELLTRGLCREMMWCQLSPPTILASSNRERKEAQRWGMHRHKLALLWSCTSIYLWAKNTLVKTRLERIISRLLIVSCQKYSLSVVSRNCSLFCTEKKSDSDKEDGFVRVWPGSIEGHWDGHDSCDGWYVP